MKKLFNEKPIPVDLTVPLLLIFKKNRELHLKELYFLNPLANLDVNTLSVKLSVCPNYVPIFMELTVDTLFAPFAFNIS